MPTIPLNRRFIEWREDSHSDPDLWALFKFSGGFTWDELLRRRRVVLLAEAGSGKTE